MFKKIEVVYYRLPSSIISLDIFMTMFRTNQIRDFHNKMNTITLEMGRVTQIDVIENTSLQKYIYKHAFFHLMMNNQTVEILNLINNPSFFPLMVQSVDTFVEPFNFCRIMDLYLLMKQLKV